MGRKKAETLECVRESDKSKKRKSHEKFLSSEPRFQISIAPQTENQILFLKSLRKDTIIVGHGCPGSGKCIGPEEEIEIMVDDEFYKQLLLYFEANGITYDI